MQPRVNKNQRTVMEAVRDLGETSSSWPTTRMLTDYLDPPEAWRGHWTIDQVTGILRRLQDRGLVTEDDNRPKGWAVTMAGRGVL